MCHRGAIEANNETLMRCTHIDDCVALCLWSEKAIDEEMKSRLEAERSVYHRCVQLYEWLKQQNIEIYKRFLRSMLLNSQQHVSNLLRNFLNDSHVPLSNARYARVRSMASDLLFMIYNSEELVSMLQTSKAIASADCEELRMDRTNCKKNSILINSILRRSEYSFDRLREALIETKQSHIADALIEGEIVRVHVETSQWELDDELSNALNDSQLRGSLFDELHSQGIHFIRSKPDHSILIYFYCKKPDHMIKFTQHFDNNRLNMTDILNCLLKTMKSKETISLFVNLHLEDEDILRIQDFTGLENWMSDRFQQRKSMSGARKYTPIPSDKKFISKDVSPQFEDTKTSKQRFKKKDWFGSKSPGKQETGEFEFLTAEMECLQMKERVRDLEAELERKEKEWMEEKQKLINKQNEIEEKLQKQNKISYNLRFGGSGKCRDESEKQTTFQNTV